ncbi:MAG: RpiR family carbohydrate utilization transcriptional regulator [Clostridium sp.]
MKYKVIQKLKERRFVSKISKSEEAVFDYLEKHFKSIPQISVIQLSQKSFTSQATINRACKTLGFNGYSELKYAIKEDLASIETHNKKHINKTEFFVDKINFASAENITKYFKDSNLKILIYGLGGSEISAKYFQRQLLYLGIPTLLVTQEEMLDYFKEYVIVIFSSSGETIRTNQIAKKAKTCNMHVVAITKKDSSLAQISDSVFYHEINIDKLDGISREQQIHMIIMVNELIDQIANIL